jgi:hypothetical protein
LKIHTESFRFFTLRTTHRSARSVVRSWRTRSHTGRHEQIGARYARRDGILVVPPTLAAGIEIQYDREGNAVAPFKAGVDHLWITENKDARFGDFDTANLEQFLKVKDGFRTDIASVTGTPLYYLLPARPWFASGEAMRKAESRFIAKVRDRQTSFWPGVVGRDAVCLQIEGHRDVILKNPLEDAARLTEKEMLENLLLKKELGLTPNESWQDLTIRPDRKPENPPLDLQTVRRIAKPGLKGRAEQSGGQAS